MNISIQYNELYLIQKLIKKELEDNPYDPDIIRLERKLENYSKYGKAKKKKSVAEKLREESDKFYRLNPHLKPKTKIEEEEKEQT